MVRLIASTTALPSMATTGLIAYYWLHNWPVGTAVAIWFLVQAAIAYPIGFYLILAHQNNNH